MSFSDPPQQYGCWKAPVRGLKAWWASSTAAQNRKPTVKARLKRLILIYTEIRLLTVIPACSQGSTREAQILFQPLPVNTRSLYSATWVLIREIPFTKVGGGYHTLPCCSPVCLSGLHSWTQWLWRAGFPWLLSINKQHPSCDHMRTPCLVELWAAVPWGCALSLQRGYVLMQLSCD